MMLLYIKAAYKGCTESLCGLFYCTAKKTLDFSGTFEDVLQTGFDFLINTVSLKKNIRFKNVYKNGSSVVNRHFVMIILPNGEAVNRLGITVSKKVGNSVVRHRVTRLIREAYRLNEGKLQPGYDIVVIARVNSAAIKFSEAERSLMHLAAKSGLKE